MDVNRTLEVRVLPCGQQPALWNVGGCRWGALSLSSSGGPCKLWQKLRGCVACVCRALVGTMAANVGWAFVLRGESSLSTTLILLGLAAVCQKN